MSTNTVNKATKIIFCFSGTAAFVFRPLLQKIYPIMVLIFMSNRSCFRYRGIIFNSSASATAWTKLRIVTNNQEQSHIGAFATAILLITSFFQNLQYNIVIFLCFDISVRRSVICFYYNAFSWVLLKNKAENSQNMATNSRLFLNYCTKIWLNVNLSTSFTLFSYILCIFVRGLVKNNRKQ